MLPSPLVGEGSGVRELSLRKSEDPPHPDPLPPGEREKNTPLTPTLSHQGRGRKTPPSPRPSPTRGEGEKHPSLSEGRGEFGNGFVLTAGREIAIAQLSRFNGSDRSQGDRAMAGWRFLFVATALLGGTAGCCSTCDSTYAHRHPVAAPVYGAGCTPCPCQPVQQPCCPCPVGYTPVAGAAAGYVPPPPPPPGQPVSNWQRAPVNGCCP
jgi:hypothetical protein